MPQAWDARALTTIPGAEGESSGENCFAKELGLKQMILAFSLPAKGRTTLGLGARAGNLNKIGEQTRKPAFRQVFTTMLSNSADRRRLIYDKLMSEFDPKLVKMQFQRLSRDWVRGPTISISILADSSRFTFRTGHPGKEMVPLVRAQIDWKKLFTAAKKAGVRTISLR